MGRHTGRLDEMLAQAEQEARERSPQDPAMQAQWIAGRAIAIARDLAHELEGHEPAADEIPVRYLGETWGVALQEPEDDFDRRPELVGISLRGVEVTYALSYSVQDRLYELALERLEQMREDAA